jgi:hypothetical protein
MSRAPAADSAELSGAAGDQGPTLVIICHSRTRSTLPVLFREPEYDAVGLGKRGRRATGVEDYFRQWRASCAELGGLSRVAHETARNIRHFRLGSRHKNAARGAICRISGSQGVSS